MWSESNSLLIKTPSNQKSNSHSKICSFDLDHTLVTQKSGKTFPEDENDWIPLFKNVKEKIQHLSKDYTLVIFTNQSGIKKGKVSKESFQSRVDNVCNYLEVDMWCFAATDDDHYRKPGIGMWEHMLSLLDCDIDNKGHFYIGDAAGRIKGWDKGKKKDFSCSDRKFAWNIGKYYEIELKFQTPEEFFLNQPHLSEDKWIWDTFDVGYIDLNLLGNNFHMSENEKQEMILMIGPPGSGKSRITQKFFPNYVRINRDTLKTKTKCINLTKKALSEGQSVVIDNTNPTTIDRKVYLDLAKNYTLKVRCIVMKIEKAFANHLNNVRVQITKGETKKIPMVVYHTFYKKFQYPTKDEGIHDIIEANFLDFGYFDSENDQKLFLLKY